MPRCTENNVLRIIRSANTTLINISQHKGVHVFEVLVFPTYPLTSNVSETK